MSTGSTTDQELVKQYQEGNEDALTTLIAKYRDRIYLYVYHLIKNEALAEDVFQDTFFKIITQIKKGKYTEEGKFLPWATRIAHNLVIDHFRNKQKLPVFETKDEEFDIFKVLPLKQGNMEDAMIKKQIHQDIRMLIKKLPAEQREVLIMRLYNDMSFKEIAQTTSVSINTALGRMRYALLNLRKYYKEHERRESGLKNAS